MPDKDNVGLTHDESTRSSRRGAKLFISYAREDIEFVRSLRTALDDLGHQSWIDEKGIAPTANWLQRILQAIVECEYLVFVVSPSSVASEMCQLELGHAASLNKDLAPILLHPITTELPGELARFQWSDFSSQERFQQSLSELDAALRRDPEWLTEHARLLTAATAWETRQRPWSELLHGAEVRAAERWLAAADGERRQPTSLHARYIRASRRFQFRWRAALAASSAILLTAAAIGAHYGQLRSREAEARDLAARADQLRATDPARQETSTLMLVEAIRRLGQIDIRATGVEASLRESASMLLEPRASGTHPGGIGGIAVDAAHDTVATYAGSLRAEVSAQWNGQIDTTVRLWSVPSDHPWAVLPHSSLVFSAAFDRDGRLVTGDMEGHLTVWDPNRLRVGSNEPSPERVLRQSGAIVSIVAVPATSLVLAASSEGVVCAWDMASGDRRYCFEHGNGEGAALLAVSPDGAYLATAGEKGMVQLRNVPDGRLLATMAHSSAAAIRALAFSPASNQLATGGLEGEFHIWSVPEGHDQFPYVHRGDVTDINYVPRQDDSSSGYIATTSTDGSLRLLDGWIGKGWLVSELRDSYAIARMAGDSGGRIAVARGDGYVDLWAPAEGRIVGRIRITSGDVATGLAFVGSNLLVVADGGGGLRFFEDTAGRDAWAQTTGFAVSRLSLASNGSMVVAADFFGSSAAWLLGPNGPSPLPLALPPVDAMAVSPSGDRLAIADTQSGKLHLVTLPDGAAIADLPLDQNIGDLAWSRQGTALAVTRRDGGLWIYDPTMRQLLRHDQIGGTQLSFDRSGAWLAIVAPNKGLQLWHWAEGVPWPVPHADRVELALFAPPAPILLTADDDGLVRSWGFGGGGDPPSVQKSVNLCSEIAALAVSGDGKFVAAGCKDGRIGVWTVTNLNEVASLSYPGEVGALMFSGDGKLVIAGGRLGLRGYHVTTDALVTAACSRVGRNLTSQEWQQQIGGDCRGICPGLPACGS